MENNNDSCGLASKYLDDLRVAVYRGGSSYCSSVPFNPHAPYPEYEFPQHICCGPNPAYEAVRSCFELLDLDCESRFSPRWNPLRGLIKPGETVVIKPNFVLSAHYDRGNLFSIITHPSVIRAIVDYVYKALGGQGKIIIADAPQMDCHFSELLDRTQLCTIQEFYWRERKFEIQIIDLRNFWLDRKPGDVAAFASRRKQLSGDPAGDIVVNLGARSEFYNVKAQDRFYGADYNREETIAHHSGEVQEYMISRTILNSDTLIMVPKLKVHKKVGVTLNAKGLVGINTNKNYIVHYTLGAPEQGGDQFPPLHLTRNEQRIIQSQRFLYDLLLSKRNPHLDAAYGVVSKVYKKLLKPVIGSGLDKKKTLDGGNWYGNDSAWRMVSDLMRIGTYADRSGTLRDVPQRKILSVIDGIVGGEKNGPLTPSEKKAGTVVAGFNPLAVDIVATRLMGFDWQKLKWITNLLANKYIDHVGDITVKSKESAVVNMFSTDDKLLNFVPHPGWQNYIEIA